MCRPPSRHRTCVPLAWSDRRVSDPAAPRTDAGAQSTRPAWRLVRSSAAGSNDGRSIGSWSADAMRVIAHDRGPLLVVGGPGTGKTSLLVASVAARVASGADPSRIVVLTFGRRGAADLRRRVEAALAEVGASDGRGRVRAEPVVRTFHAYAFGLLRRAATDA